MRIPRSVTAFVDNLLPHEHRLQGRAMGFLAILTLFCFLPGFFTLPPTDRDEARFAQASKQMLQSGDLVDIRFQEDTRYKKPVGIYWLQAGTVALWQTLTGDTADNRIWLYRLPSLLGALLSVLLTALIGTKLYNSRIGLAAGIMMATCLLLNVEARLAKTDAMLLATVLASQLVLAKSYMLAESKKLKAKDFVLFWGGLAAGFLIKGPIILLVVLGTLLMLALQKTSLTFLKKLKPAWGVPLSLALVLPWFVMINMKTHGAFLQDSAGHDLFAKIWEGQNWGGAWPGLHAVVLMGVFWPASLPVLLSLPYTWRTRHDRPVRFLTSWLIPTWLVFELTFTKLPHYVLPAYPALAVLAAAFLFSDLKDTCPRPYRYAVLIGWALCSAGLALLPVFLPILLEHSLFLIAALMAGLTLGISLGASRLFAKDQAVLGFTLLPLAGLFFMFTLFGLFLPNLAHVFLSRQITAFMKPTDACPSWRIVTAGYNEPSLVFLAGTDTRFVDDAAKVAAIMKEEPCILGVIEEAQQDVFLAQFKNTMPDKKGRAEGFNYGKGRAVKFGLFSLIP